MSVDGALPNTLGLTPSPRVFSAETCYRHVYVGYGGALVNLPYEVLTHPRTKLSNGITAYKRIMEIITGVKNNKYIDKEASGQIRRGWNAFEERVGIASKPLSPFMQALFADAKTIKNGLLQQNLRQATFENAAINLAALTPNDTALVVGGAVDETVKLVKTLAHPKEFNPGRVLLAHHDKQPLSCMLEALKGLPKASAVSVPVEPILLSRALSEETFRAGAVFVCLPMTEGGDLEASCVDMINLTIMENWKKRNNSSNNRGRLVHLNAAPQKMGKARDVWLGFHGTHGFVSLLDIQGERVRCASHVDDLRRKATEAISYMAACRYDGNRRVTEVALDCATMQLRFKGAKPPPAYYAG